MSGLSVGESTTGATTRGRAEGSHAGIDGTDGRQSDHLTTMAELFAHDDGGYTSVAEVLLAARDLITAAPGFH